MRVGRRPEPLCDDGSVEKRTVYVSAARLARWTEGFSGRHGGASHEVLDGALHLTGADGGTATVTPSFPVLATTLRDFTDAVRRIPRTGVILIRRGGFAAAVVDGDGVISSDVGKRHVQGRTAAGGWSQQRFARRRDKQVHELVDAAAGYAARIILPALPVDYVATGGDRALVDEVLGDPRLRSLTATPRGPHLDVPDPRRDVINSLPDRLSALRIDLVDP